MVKRTPFGWVEAQAWDFPALWRSITKHQPEDHPVSAWMIAVIFFEETAFCNVKQAGTKGTLGIGFGQLEVSNPEKRAFYEWLLGSPTDADTIAFMMLESNDFAVQVHCKYFQWLTSAQNPSRVSSLEGCLNAQVGSHKEFVNLFIQGEKEFRKAWDKNNRIDYARALNFARANGPKENGIPVTGKNAFTEFWEFILPDTFFKLGY